MTNSRKPRKSPNQNLDRTVALLGFLGVGVIGMFLFGSIYWLTRPYVPSPVVVQALDVGRVKTASFSHTTFPDCTRTAVETEKGSFLVAGAFVALKDHPLVLEQRKDGTRMLCDRAQTRCLPLVQ